MDCPHHTWPIRRLDDIISCPHHLRVGTLVIRSCGRMGPSSERADVAGWALVARADRDGRRGGEVKLGMWKHSMCFWCIPPRMETPPHTLNTKPHLRQPCPQCPQCPIPCQRRTPVAVHIRTQRRASVHIRTQRLGHDETMGPSGRDMGRRCIFIIGR